MHRTQEALVFRIDEKLLQRRPPRLTLATTLTALCKQMKTGDLDTNFVVDILNENGLLPYMIGHSNQSLLDVSLGRNTNASKVGDLIVSEECIRGTYELCISFLEFVLATICDTNYRDSSKTMLASVTYVANEIYTSHNIWAYKDINDMNKILCLCTEIFHHIIANIRDDPNNVNRNNDLEIVCILSLSQNQAHKQLLDVIVEGKDSIKKKMDKLNSTSELSLRDEPVIISVRQSLSIFNKLLSHSKFIKEYCDSETLGQSNFSSNHYQHGASSSTAPSTNIERALFDTSIRPGLLQHIFSYIYQKSDSATACLAVDLITNVAKKFSMSLMACLGSEADRVCEFFIECLNDKDANLNLDVAILDLLSTFVKHQPGLIELFLNFRKESKENADGEAVPSNSLGSLDVIMNLLKQSKVRQENGHKLLHSYVTKLILTFWQKQHSAIRQFDKADQFWESVAHPLVKFLDSNKSAAGTTRGPQQTATSEVYDSVQILNDELDSHSLMILAREIFFLNVGISERVMSPNLRKILDDMSTRNFLGEYSKSLRTRYPLLIANSAAKGQESGRLLMAWRDFLLSFAKYKPIEMNDSIQNQIIEDLLSCMTAEINLGIELDKERMAAIGDTLLILWTKWMPKSSSGADVFNSIHELLYLADSFKEYLPFSFLLTFQSTLNIYLMRHREYLIDSKRLSDLLTPALQLMQFSLRIMENYLRDHFKGSSVDYKPEIESRLCLASIMTLRFIIDVSRRDVSLWLFYLQTNLKTDALVQFLTYLMNKRVCSEICLSVVELLLCLSSIPETADYLNKAGLVSQVNMIAVSAYEKPYAHLSQLASINPVNKAQVNDAAKLYLDSANSDHQWLPIWWHIARLNISMMLTLDSDFMASAVEFLTIHSLRICELLELLRTKPRSVNMEEATQIAYMINLVLRHGCIWKKRSSQSYQAISEEVFKTAYSLTNDVLPVSESEDFNRLIEIFKMSKRYLSLNKA